MRLRQLFEMLLETPIEDYQLVGDFSKGYSMKSKTDRRLLSNPRYAERIKNMFANTQVDFRMFFVNMPGAEQYIEMGNVNEEYLTKNLPEVYAQIQQQGGFGPQSINILYTNNQGAERRPMTGWIIAHRAGHALLRQSKNTVGRAFGGYSTFFGMIQAELIDKIKYVMDMYGAQIPRGRESMPGGGWRTTKDPNYDSTLVRSFLAKIGTFRSARENNMRTMGEFIYECFAQYLIKGEITFNEAPQQITTGHVWGKPQQSSQFGQPEQSESKIAFEYVQDVMQQEFERVLHMSVGKIFIM